MTLVELLIASVIAIVVLAGAISFFSNNSDKIQISELELQNLALLQQLNASVIRDLRSVRQLNRDRSGIIMPIDLFGVEPQPGISLRRNINTSLRHDGPGFSREKDLEPFVYNFRSTENSLTGTSTWSSTVSSDNFFQYPDTIAGMQQAQSIMLATARDEKKIDWKNAQKVDVTDFIFWNGTQKMRYRYFKETSQGEPLYFVKLDMVDANNEWANVRIFGGVENEPWITDFRITTLTQFRCIYYSDGAEWHGFDGLSFGISIGVSSPTNIAKSYGSRGYKIEYKLESGEQRTNLTAASYDDIGLY